MNPIRRFFIGSPRSENAEAPNSHAHERREDPLSLIGTLCFSLLAMTASALISGLVVLVISRFGAGGGLPVLGFRGAMALALLGSWFSMGTAGVPGYQKGAFPKSLVQTLTHQISSALLMILLLVALSLLLAWGSR